MYICTYVYMYKHLGCDTTTARVGRTMPGDFGWVVGLLSGSGCTFDIGALIGCCVVCLRALLTGKLTPPWNPWTWLRSTGRTSSHPLGRRVRAAVEQRLYLSGWIRQSFRIQMALRRRCDLRWDDASAFHILYEGWFLLRDPDRVAVLRDVSLLDLEFLRCHGLVCYACDKTQGLTAWTEPTWAPLTCLFRKTQADFCRTLRGAVRLGGCLGPRAAHADLQALGLCFCSALVLGGLCAIHGGAVYFAGMLILQAMHPTGHSHRLHQIKCPSHRLQLGHLVCSLCILAAWMSQAYARSLVWVVWAQALPGFGVPVMSEDDDRRSSDTEALFAGETGDLGRGTRLWELPRGPPTTGPSERADGGAGTAGGRAQSGPGHFPTCVGSSGGSLAAGLPESCS